MWNRYSFDDLKKRIEKRLSFIDYEPEKYDLSTISFENRTTETTVVKYENVEAVRFDYYISNIIQPDGRLTLQGRITIRLLNDSEWYKGKVESFR